MTPFVPSQRPFKLETARDVPWLHIFLKQLDTSGGLSVIFLDWVNSGAPWWSRSLTGLDPVDLIGWMEWI